MDSNFSEKHFSKIPQSLQKIQKKFNPIIYNTKPECWPYFEFGSNAKSHYLIGNELL